MQGNQKEVAALVLDTLSDPAEQMGLTHATLFLDHDSHLRRMLTRHLRQALNGSFADFYVGGCSTVGETHRYWQQLLYTGVQWRVRSNIDLTVIRESAFNPVADWTGPYWVQFSSETYYVESHVPGSPGSKQDSSNMQVQRWSDNAWVTACGNSNLGAGNDNPARWDQDALSCNHMRSWTK